MGPGVGASAGTGFRPELEGLRGFAILLVVVFHARLLGLSGGFVGVDIFFVLSGFLITGGLIGRAGTSGVGWLGDFWSRRIRRILPVSLAVIAVTLGAAFVTYSPLDRSSIGTDAASAVLGIANLRFAIGAGDYFAAAESPSPFLHFWALAVEIQFYLVWPAVVVLADRAKRPLLAAGIVLIGVLAASFAANLLVTDAAANWAFYLMPTRLWEFAAGGLLAVLPRPSVVAVRRLAGVAGWLGLGAICWAAASFDGEMAYPGLAALVPTLGACAVIGAGMSRLGPGRLLASPPARLLGQVSYSLYLWHWPILVMPAAALEAELDAGVRALLVLLAIAVAWLSWRWIEVPWRTGAPRIAGISVRPVRSGIVAVLALLVAAGGLSAAQVAPPHDAAVASSVPAGSSSAPIETPQPTVTAPDPTGSSPGPTRETPPPTGPASPDPTPPSPTPTPAPTPWLVRLPGDVRPPLARARLDEERLRADGCLAFEGRTTPSTCVYGDAGGAFTVALVGDSHAAQWFPALEQIAIARHWRVLTYVKVACPFIDMRVRNVLLKREYTECAAYNRATIKRLLADPPDLTLVSMSRFAIHPVLARDTTLDAQATAVARMLRQLPGRVALIVDTPEAGRDIPSCLSRHAGDVRVCAISHSVAYSGSLGALERSASESSGAGVIDLTGRICRDDPCPVVVDGMILFRDSRHLTATFSASLAPDLERAIDALLLTPTDTVD
jgi:peptidoglycan/LPS O-acetylase OafA/YrhL